MDKLAEIMAHTRAELAGRLRPVRDVELARFGQTARPGPTFGQALRRGSGELALIGEIKRRSPSAGTIADLPEAEEQARRYINAQADALSVLTDETYFGGSLRDLWEVTDFLHDRARPVPSLRKDFMVHPLQVVEAAEAGARAILIIVRALSDHEIRTLYQAADTAGLCTLFEVHTREELDRALAHEPKIVGVNNRDLTRFVTDLAISEALIPHLPPGVVRVSESGICDAEGAQRAADCGADAILVGEALMRAEDPEALARELRAVRVR